MTHQPEAVYITANSPGEVAGFVTPMVSALRAAMPEARIVVILLPCTFATGREEDVVRSVLGVDEVYPARSILHLLREAPPFPPRALLHLGGDLAYAARLARAWKVPTWGYQWAQPRWDGELRGYFVKIERDRERLVRQGIAPHKVHVVGDLIVDAVAVALERAPREEQEASKVPQPPDPSTSRSGAPRLVLLTGSRLNEVRCLAPFYLDVADTVQRAHPGAEVSLLISPFLDPTALRTALRLPPDPCFGGQTGQLSEPSAERWLLTGANGCQLHLVRSHPLQSMAQADLVVSIPGTKTGEAGALARPMLVLLPLNRPEEIPYFGLIGLLDWIPFVGKPLKGTILRQLAKRKRMWLAQPNILADAEVVPELWGILSAAQVAQRVLALLGEQGKDGHAAAGEDRVRMQARLRALYQPFAGASHRVAANLAQETARQSASQGPTSAERSSQP